MMTEEEVAQVMAYCDENKTSYKQRLAELGINPWSFYDAKRKYVPKEEGEDSGEFLQLTPGGAFLPNPIKPPRSRGGRRKDPAQGTVAVSVVHPCLVWNAGCATGSTASRRTCGRASIR